MVTVDQILLVKKNIFGTVERFEKSNLSEFLLDKKSIAE